MAQISTGLDSSGDHDTVARAVARVGSELLGLSSGAPQATSGEEDAFWEVPAPRRTLTFEIKLAPKALPGKGRSSPSGRWRPSLRRLALVRHLMRAAVDSVSVTQPVQKPKIYC